VITSNTLAYFSFTLFESTSFEHLNEYYTYIMLNLWQVSSNLWYFAAVTSADPHINIPHVTWISVRFTVDLRAELPCVHLQRLFRNRRKAEIQKTNFRTSVIICYYFLDILKKNAMLWQKWHISRRSAFSFFLGLPDPVDTTLCPRKLWYSFKCLSLLRNDINPYPANVENMVSL